MPARKKRKTKAKTSAQGDNSFFLFLAGVTLLLVFYLYGKVQIHVDLKRIDKIAEEMKSLERKRDNLRINVNGLKGYQRIVREAKKQGLVFVDSDKMSKIYIEFDKEEKGRIQDRGKVHYAGMSGIVR